MNTQKNSLNISQYTPPGSWAKFKSLIEMFDLSCQKYGDKNMLDFLGSKYTYAQVHEASIKAARALQKLGVKKGTRVGLCLPNTPYSVIMYYGILKAGGTVVNFNPLYSKREMIGLINNSNTQIMVSIDLNLIYDKLEDCLKETCLEKIIVCNMCDILSPVKRVLFKLFKSKELAKISYDDNHIPYSQFINHNETSLKSHSLDVKDVAVLQYTGGTTGLPKAAMLTHSNLITNTNQMANWLPQVDFGNEKIITILPLFHVFAMTAIMNVGICLGAELILMPRFVLKDTLKAVHKHKVTFFVAVPTIYTALNNTPDLHKYDLSSIKYALSGGAPMPHEVQKEFEKNANCRLIEGYGLSETSPMVVANPLVGQTKIGSIGIPVPDTDVQVRDPENPSESVSLGEKGEICIKGPQVMKGYLDNPEATKNAFTKDGYFRTGDIGYQDEDGFIFLVDRIKDVILCGGYNVYPRNIEEAIYLHPSVAEVTVIGVDDDYRGQTPKAFVKVQDNSQLTPDELKTFLKKELSPIEIPTYVEFRDELPKTMIGKLSKKELVEEERQKAHQ